MDQIKVGIIGFGYWGPNLTRNFYDIPVSDLVAEADLREDRLQRAHSLYPNITLVKDYKELFDLNLDAVVISTPPVTHHPIAKDCLEHGLHVLVEKPMTLNSQRAAFDSSLSKLSSKRMVSVVVFMYDNVLQNGRSVKFCDGRSRQIGRQPSSIHGLPWFSLQQQIKHNVCIIENHAFRPIPPQRGQLCFHAFLSGISSA